ncbi:uncharacterized protein LOC121370334 [Gigantopelta aegis]|uniref:uncharacterized protein LOC121370334 n=1 Tax=Gigantopelta aegis TaxID=1735272 RepID=UPI001B88BD9D|nr:uncharacterized protein LOC121370334 [Gigantopelta aegis]
MHYSGRCIAGVGAVCGLACIGIGVLIGYFARDASVPNKEPETAYLKSCRGECQTQEDQVKSCTIPYPGNYVSYYLHGKTITIDGKLDDEAWKEVSSTENFVDIRGLDYPAPRLETRVKLRWDDTNLYVGAYLQEPHVWTTFTEKDTRLYKNNAFETFFDVDGSMQMYKEFEINALNTTWDLMLTRAYMDGGDFVDWEGIADKAVYTDGVVNDPSSKPTFWSLEVVFPFVNLAENTTRHSGPAVDGEVWFMVLARPQYETEVVNGKYQKVPGSKASWYSWVPVGAVNLHLPSKWGLLEFSKGQPQKNPTFSFSRWTTYQALFDIFNAEKTFNAVNAGYVSDLKLLTLPPYITSGDCVHTINVQVNNDQFEVTLRSKTEPRVTAHINNNRTVWFT